jgi:hypothetical protein
MLRGNGVVAERRDDDDDSGSLDPTKGKPINPRPSTQVTRLSPDTRSRPRWVCVLVRGRIPCGTSPPTPANAWSCFTCRSLIRTDGLEGAVLGGGVTHVVHPRGSRQTSGSLPGCLYAWLFTTATVEGLTCGRPHWAAGQIENRPTPGQRVSARPSAVMVSRRPVNHATVAGRAGVLLTGSRSRLPSARAGALPLPADEAHTDERPS